jgi:hypothetical protein
MTDDRTPPDPRFRALDGIEPTDQWDEITRRAAASDGAVGVGDDRPRRRAALVVAAALLFVLGVVGAALALSGDDRTKVDTSPADQSSTTAVTPTTLFDGGGCGFGFEGDPQLTGGPADPPLIEPSGTTAHGVVGEQTIEIHVPGTVVIDLVGEQTQEIDYGRGPATLWFWGDGTVQVRYFPAGGPSNGTDKCQSYDVTVAGPDTDANRHVAIDIAQRVQPGAARDQATPPVTAADLVDTTWEVVQLVVDGTPKVLPPPTITVTFSGAQIYITSECGPSFVRDYSVRDNTLITTTSDHFAQCADGAGSSTGLPAVAAVFDNNLRVSLDGDALLLSDDHSKLVLHAA